MVPYVKHLVYHIDQVNEFGSTLKPTYDLYHLLDKLFRYMNCFLSLLLLKSGRLDTNSLVSAFFGSGNKLC